MSSYEKGLELEELVSRLFAAKGYDVKHDIKLKGRSGVTHQIDVYAEYRCPLHVSRIVIECKAYDKPVDKDIVMKLIHEVSDLGMDRGILVTTSYFTWDAVKTAEGYNIDLWDNAKLKELLDETGVLEERVETPSNVYYVKPLVAIEDAEKTLSKHAKGILSGVKSVEFIGMKYYPYYEINMDIVIVETRGFLFKKEEEK